MSYLFLITTMGMLFQPNFDLTPNLLGIPYVFFGTSVVVIPVWWFVLRPLYTRLPAHTLSGLRGVVWGWGRSREVCWATTLGR